MFHDRPPDGRTRTVRARVVPSLWKTPAPDVIPGASPLRHLPDPRSGRVIALGVMARNRKVATVTGGRATRSASSSRVTTEEVR